MLSYLFDCNIMKPTLQNDFFAASKLNRKNKNVYKNNKQKSLKINTIDVYYIY